MITVLSFFLSSPRSCSGPRGCQTALKEGERRRPAPRDPLFARERTSGGRRSKENMPDTTGGREIGTRGRNTKEREGKTQRENKIHTECTRGEKVRDKTHLKQATRLVSKGRGQSQTRKRRDFAAAMVKSRLIIKRHWVK